MKLKASKTALNGKAALPKQSGFFLLNEGDRFQTRAEKLGEVFRFQRLFEYQLTVIKVFDSSDMMGVISIRCSGVE